MSNHLTSVNEIDFAPNSDVFPSPRDWRDNVMYFLLVDRFDNNADNIPEYEPGSSGAGRDPAQGGIFQGGNLKGIIRRLDYIKDLGCNTIWISPIFKNRIEKNDSYHGYGIQDFLEIDPRFGTMDDMRALVKEAHSRGMYVVQDIIFNHTGDNWSYPGGYEYRYWKDASGPFDFGYWREADQQQGFQADDAVWPMELQSVECYKRRGSIVDWNDNDQAVNGDFCSLKELDLKHSGVLDTLIKSYKYWIAQTDIDGFRIDTVKHMEDDSVAVFCNAVREYATRIGKNNFFMFGEIVAGDDVLQRYLGRNSRIEGTNERFASLDACLDFPLYFVLEEVIKGFINPGVLRMRYDAFHTVYADHGQAGKYFVTFVDNHDQMTRPYRRFMHGNPNKQQAVLAVAYLLTSQGVPCIYYGTEQGFDGGGDNDRYVRECMFGGNWGAFNTTGVHFFRPGNEIYQGIKRIAGLRVSEPALRYGRQYFREISGNGIDFGYPLDGNCTFAYSRILDTEEVIVAMNLSSNHRSDCVTVDCMLTPAGGRVRELTGTNKEYDVQKTGSRSYVRLDLAPYEMVILKK